jgi:hypothetical protein
MINLAGRRVLLTGAPRDIDGGKEALHRERLTLAPGACGRFRYLAIDPYSPNRIAVIPSGAAEDIWIDEFPPSAARARTSLR